MQGSEARAQVMAAQELNAPAALPSPHKKARLTEAAPAASSGADPAFAALLASALAGQRPVAEAAAACWAADPGAPGWGEEVARALVRAVDSRAESTVGGNGSGLATDGNGDAAGPGPGSAAALQEAQERGLLGEVAAAVARLIDKRSPDIAALRAQGVDSASLHTMAISIAHHAASLLQDAGGGSTGMQPLPPQQ